MKIFKNKLPKMIITYYINVKNLPSDQIEYYMKTVQDNLALNVENVVEFFIPVIDQITKIECTYVKK